MAYTAFLPKPGRLGIAPTAFQSGALNLGTLAAGTQTHNMGAFPNKAYVDSIVVCAGTFPTASTSCTIQISTFDGTNTVNLTAATDINAKTAGAPVALSLLSTLTEAQRTLSTIESLQVSVVTVGTVSVQPVDLTVTVQLSVEN